MTTFAVTVTYGNRFHLLKQVIESALSEGVTKVIVVDNNSMPESREKLKAYEKELGNDKIKVLYLDDNYGSAGGFKRGLEEAYNDSKCEYIWLLDDDNVPQVNSLKNLAKTLECFNNDKVVLVSYRKIFDPISKQILDKNALYQNVSSGEILGQDKTFLDKVISKFYQKDNDKKEINFPIARRRHASYGGLFINKTIIEKIGYPNEAFYLYADDIEYSQRMENHQYVIYTCFFSQIIDIDVQLGGNGNFSEEQSDMKIYYAIRNHTYLSSKSHSQIYFRIQFLKIIIKNINKIKDYKFFMNRLKLINKAFTDGIHGNLGKTI